MKKAIAVITTLFWVICISIFGMIFTSEETVKLDEVCTIQGVINSQDFLLKKSNLENCDFSDKIDTLFCENDAKMN